MTSHSRFYKEMYGKELNERATKFRRRAWNIFLTKCKRAARMKKPPPPMRTYTVHMPQ